MITKLKFPLTVHLIAGIIGIVLAWIMANGSSTQRVRADMRRIESATAEIAFR